MPASGGAGASTALDRRPGTRERDAALVAAIEQRRGGQLLNLDRMLLWSEPLARSWNVFLKTLRQELSLAPKLREPAICVVARATGADYEFHHHAPEFAKVGGKCRPGRSAGPTRTGRPPTPLFDPLEPQRDRLRAGEHP